MKVHFCFFDRKYGEHDYLWDCQLDALPRAGDDIHLPDPGEKLDHDELRHEEDYATHAIVESLTWFLDEELVVVYCRIVWYSDEDDLNNKEADMPKPDVKVKFPKGTKSAPGKAGITYNKQGPSKRRAVLDVTIAGNSTKVTIDYDYPSVPPELLALIDAQYEDAVVQLNADGVSTAEDAMAFLNTATSILSDAIADGVKNYTEA